MCYYQLNRLESNIISTSYLHFLFSPCKSNIIELYLQVHVGCRKNFIRNNSGRQHRKSWRQRHKRTFPLYRINPSTWGSSSPPLTFYRKWNHLDLLRPICNAISSTMHSERTPNLLSSIETQKTLSCLTTISRERFQHFNLMVILMHFSNYSKARRSSMGIGLIGCRDGGKKKTTLMSTSSRMKRWRRMLSKKLVVWLNSWEESSPMTSYKKLLIVVHSVISKTNAWKRSNKRKKESVITGRGWWETGLIISHQNKPLT